MYVVYPGQSCLPPMGWLPPRKTKQIMTRNQRHRTAMSRTTLSRPLRLALESGLIDNESPVLDYGCGRGDDVRAWQARGIPCQGWDPVYRPEGKRQESDVVNVDCVVNVIEDPAERVETLRQAWQLAHKVKYSWCRLASRLSHLAL
jgi:DNA phosphorothioation-associated putative methyltransferase